jgi:cell division protein FtsL
VTSLTHSDAAAAVVRTRRSTRRKARARGGILWIVVSGILLTGVVFVNVAVLQLNLSLDNASADKAKLQADNAALQSQYSSLVSSPRVSGAAYRRLGLTFLDPSSYTYINVANR